MRLIILFFSFVALAACSPKNADHSRQPCFVNCISPSMKVSFTSLPSDSTMNLRLRSYEKNGAFTQLVADKAVLNWPRLDTVYDYEIYLTDMNKSFRISNISFTQTREQAISTNKGCMGGCYNPLDTMTVTFDGQPHSFEFKRTNQTEHTLFL